MINTMLAMNFGERTAYAGKVFLIGMGTVFAALIVLWIVLVLFRKCVAYFSGEDLKNTPTASASAPTPAPAAAQSVAVTPKNDDAVIAVITAAVAAALAEENGGAVPGFRVVSFQKVSTVSKRK